MSTPRVADDTCTDAFEHRVARFYYDQADWMGDPPASYWELPDDQKQKLRDLVAREPC